MKNLIRNLIALFLVVMFVTTEMLYFKFNSEIISNKLLTVKEFLTTKLLKNTTNENDDDNIDYDEMIESIENSNNNVSSENSVGNYDKNNNALLLGNGENEKFDKNEINDEVKNNNNSIGINATTESKINNNKNITAATISNLIFGDITADGENDILAIKDEIVTSDEKTYVFATVSEAYFKNTLFIGDSRTVGFHVYKTLPGATYYANQSFGVFSGFDRTMELPKFGLITLGNLLYSHKFDKIYICLGINNLGTGIPNHKKVYKKFLDTVRNLQPQAIIFLISNMHVTKAQSASNYVNNENINLVNDFIKGFADNKKTFYLDTCFLYDDEEGNLSEEYCYDGCHIKVKYYDKYLEFLLGHGVVLQENK